jgi:hypothetical protein
MEKIEKDCLSHAGLIYIGPIKDAYRFFLAQGKTVEDFDKCAWDAMTKAVRYAVELTAREVREPVWPYALDSLPAAQPAVQEPVIQNICIKCANADSWGLPDKPVCRSCVGNSEWKPLNKSSVNPITPLAQPAVQEPVGEVVIESMGVRGSDAMRVRMHFYKEIPPVGSKIYTTSAPAPKQETVAWSDAKQAEINDWFLSLPAGRQAVLLDDFGRFAEQPPAAQRQWVGLTDEEVNDCIKFPRRNLLARDGTTSQRIARAIEAKLKEKNNGGSKPRESP